MKSDTVAILTSDWHLREDCPVCRTDNWHKAMKRSLRFIEKLRKKYDCPIYLAGDLLHTAKISPYFETWCINNLPEDIIMIPGQHDLPYHSIDRFEQSSLAVLELFGAVKVKKTKFKEICDFGDWGMMHKLTWKDERPFPNCQADSAKKLLAKHSTYQLVLTGDNHQTFVETVDDRHLVNCGSLFRQTADQINHQPCIYLWWKGTNRIRKVYMPIEKDAVSREHLDVKQENDRRIDEFASELLIEKDGKIKSSINFMDNLKQLIDANDVDEKTEQKIWKFALSN